MKLGAIEFHILNDGTFRLDGGQMFGVIPRTMWERVAPPDEKNRVTFAMNSLLVRAAGKWILVDTGAGDNWDAKDREIYVFEGARLPAQLAAHGVRPEQIDIVVNTHLHFDHCGWNTRIVDGTFVPTFPNAKYYVHLGEFEHARHATERDRASYMPETFEPIAQSGQWHLIEGESSEIVPGVDVIVLPGHTSNMLGVRLSSGGQTAIFLADLVPTTAHLPLPWIMAFDLYPLTTLEQKKKWLPRIAREGWLALFCHDAKIPAAHLREQKGRPDQSKDRSRDRSKIVAEPVVVD